MFHNIPIKIKERMKYLESIDKKDKEDGTPGRLRLCQITPETGKFITLLAASAPEGKIVEIGTSGGYSTLWLSLACKEMEKKIITFEVLEDKVELARETFKLTGTYEMVDLVVGDAREYLKNYKNISFCFLDAGKEVYGNCYEAIIPNLVSGGILIADNAISHRKTLKPMLDRALSDRRVDALIVPIGKGELFCRKKYKTV